MSKKFHPHLLSEVPVRHVDGSIHMVKKVCLEEYLQANESKLPPGEAARVREQVKAQRRDYEKGK